MTRWLGPIVLLSAVVLGAAPAMASGPPVEVVASSDAGVTLRCRPGPATQGEIVIDGTDYTRVLIDRADLLGLEGAPELPVVRARVAVPYCERVRVSVSTAGTRTWPGVRVAPAPSIAESGDGDVSSYEYREGDVYDEDGLWPEAAAATFGPTWLATQRTMVVEFYPCQVAPRSETLLTHEMIEVTLSFDGLRATEPVRARRPRREVLLDLAVLNAESAAVWRGRPPRDDSRRDGDYFSTSENWARITVRESGMYRIASSDLAAADIDPGLIDPTTIRVFSGGGLPMPFSVTAERPEWMEECAILVDGEGDGSFDNGDAIVFYGLDVDGWSDELGVDDPEEPYFENPFFGEDIYWLTWERPGTPSGFSQPPRRMVVEAAEELPYTVRAEDYFERQHFERNIFLTQARSDGWFWKEMKNTGTPEWWSPDQSQSPSFDHVVPDSAGTLRARVDGNSSAAGVNPDHIALFYWNGGEVYEGQWNGYNDLVFEARGIDVLEGANEYEIYLPREGAEYSSDQILVDWFDVMYWRSLQARNDQLRFGSSGRRGIVEFAVGGFTDPSVTVFKIVDKYTATIVPGTSASGEATFTDEVADTASYAAASDVGYLVPEIEKGGAGGLRTPGVEDYIMIVYDGFYDAAVRLKNHRESVAGGGFDVRLVRVSDVYDEFSWGLTDPAAIRDYLKYTWENAVTPPTHVVLIGDASVDYRRNLSSSIPEYIPPAYMRTGTTQWPNDSWFVGFDTDSNYSMAMALGRLPARSTTELNTMIDKIVRYETEPVLGTWKNTAIIVGDDEYKFGDDCCEFYHTADAEKFACESLPWAFDRKKIYLMEYERDLVGHKSETRADLIRAWNEGALFVNYTGHGNETLMAHEVVFIYDDVSLLTNIDALPLYFAASCRLNKFDEPTVDSLGEALVKSRTGGAIASIGSTRDSAASPNSDLNRDFHEYVFGLQQDSPAAVMDIGTAFQAAFYPSSNWLNNTKFMIIGDPALTLAAPEGTGAFEADGLEPVKRMDTVTVEGANAGGSGAAEGVALVRFTDCADTSGYVHVFPESLGYPPYHVQYTLPGETVYDGPVPVHDRDLSARFVVSKFAEEGPYARLRAYFYGADDRTDGAFSLEDVSLAGSVPVADAVLPSVTAEFESGGLSILPGTALNVTAFDEHGVNLVDRVPGRGVVLTLDASGDTTSLTDGFLYEFDSFTSGSVTYELPTLSLGSHSLEVSAMDNLGNRTREQLSFEVVSTADFKIWNVANHPNPFPDGQREGTYILFQLPGDADVRIDVFTVGGRLIRTMDGIVGRTGPNQVHWDGRDQEGDELANGVYLYRIHATSEAYRGDKAEAIGRAVVMR
jgi:hypothetical protein